VDGWTDSQTDGSTYMKMLLVAFHKFAKTPKNVIILFCTAF